MKVEATYHRMNPNELDEPMTAAIQQRPTAIRLPGRLVNKLKARAKLESEAEYQSMVKAWIEERLQHETKHAR